MIPEGFQVLVRKAQAGDPNSMERLLSYIRPQLQPLARSFADPSRPVESASDLLQKSCLRAWDSLHSFEGGEDDEETLAKFRAWVGQIVRRVGMNARRERRAIRRSPKGDRALLRLDLAPDSSVDGGLREVRAREHAPSSYVRADELEGNINRFLERYRDRTSAEIVRLRFFAGLSLTAIARRLGLHYEKVRDRHRVTMERLRRELKDWL